MPTAPPLPFEAPGPGTWEMDSEHFSTALPPLIAEVFAAAFPAGMAITAERHGLPLETIACVVVHGFPYMQARPIGAPPGAAEPPAWLLRLLVPVLTRVHPTLRARLATATTLFERRPWRAVAAEWDASIRAATVAAHAAIGEVDLERLDDAGLARHLVAVRAHAIAMLTQDHSLNGSLMIPLGDYLVNVGAWTGRSEAELLNAIRGSSAISAGDSYERRRLVAALRAEPAARAALDGGASDPIGTLARLTAWPGEVGAATRGWRLITGNTLAIGIDIRHPTADEDPRQLLAALRLTLAGAGTRSRDPAVAAALRAEVPEVHRESFDRLFEDACLVYRLRDERHLYGAMPVLGVGRRAVLAAGRRLLARGALEQAEDAFLCGVDELVALLEQRTLAIDWPTRRAVYAVRAEQVPARIGPAVGAPDPDVFPAPIARVLRALNAYMRSVSGAADAAGPDATRTGGSRTESQGRSLVSAREEGALRPSSEGKPSAAEGIPGASPPMGTGMAVSRGTCEGTARVCFTVEDLARIEPGDILVAPLTTPAINIVLPILGAIVTDRGGALSHAAIVSREFGIPGVVGVRNATRTIPDGARIRVDGDRGTVTVLG